MKKKIQVLIPGGLNTDLIGLGVPRLLGSGELTLGGNLQIGPGGKSRNMAQMCSALLGPGSVVLIGKTVKDPYGLWKVPLDALQAAGVNTDYIQIEPFDPGSPKYPGIAFIPVDTHGNNQIYVLPGINADFVPGDLERCRDLFADPAKPCLLLAMEMPLPTLFKALDLAREFDLLVILDPGGISEDQLDLLLPRLDGIFLVKPNEQEAEILTGIRVHDFNTAQEAAGRLTSLGVRNVLITQGEAGAYLFGNQVGLHLPSPMLETTGEKDATGCGDQVAASLMAALIQAYPLEEAVRLAVKSGTLQFGRNGIRAVLPHEIGFNTQKHG